MSGPYSFLTRLLMVFFGIVILVIIGKQFMTPDTWGQYGHYRGAAVDEEAAKHVSYGENISCKECHEEVYDLKFNSSHKRLSCEICHGPVSDHAKDGEKFADMPVRIDDAQVDLCLKCHAKVTGRPEKFAMIEHPKHLIDQKVKVTHTCDQCHTVHAPLENMKKVKSLRTLRESLNEKE